MYAEIIHFINNRRHNLSSGFYLGKASVPPYQIRDDLLRNIPRVGQTKKFRI